MSLKVPKDWWRRFFQKDYLQVYERQDLVRAPLEVEGIIEILDLPKGCKILDLCCGYGRHSIPLAKKGYEMTGVDLSPVLLKKAKEWAREEGVQVRWLRGDMRELPFQNEFEGVINIFTAFGYFEEERENLKVLKCVSRALKKGGRFLLDTINREWIIRNFKGKDWEKIDRDTYALDERELDLIRNRIRARTLFLGKGKRKGMSHSLRLYSLGEMIHMMNEAGLSFVSCLGGLEGGEYSNESKRMVILAKKEGS